MKTFARNLMWKLAAVAAVALTASVAQAGHYSDIADHARDIEREAERAQRTVRYSFGGMPVDIQQCLLTNLYGLEENADCIQDLSRHSGHLDEIAEHAQVMGRQLAEVEEHVAELRTWCRGCVVPHHLRSSCGSMSRTHERALHELCERTEKICDDLKCMTTEINELLAEARRCGHHHQVVVPAVRPVVVPPPVVRPSVRPSVYFGISSFRRDDDHRGHDDHGRFDGRGGRHDDDHHDRGSRFGGHDSRYSRSALNVPVFRHNGRSFGFSLSIR